MQSKECPELNLLMEEKHLRSRLETVMAWIGLKKREGSARDRETVVGRKALNLGNFNGFKASDTEKRELTMFTCDFARGHREATRSELMRLTCSYCKRLLIEFIDSARCVDSGNSRNLHPPDPKFVQRHHISSGLCSSRYTAKCFVEN